MVFKYFLFVLFFRCQLPPSFFLFLMLGCVAWLVVFMPHKRSKKAEKMRKMCRLVRLERRRVFREAFYDRERGELVALKDYHVLNVECGDVLFAFPRYIHPCLVD